MAVYTLIHNSCGQTCHAERAEEKREKHMGRLVTCLGEALIDFVPLTAAVLGEGAMRTDFRLSPGGSIFNSAVAAMNCAQAGADPPRRSEVEQFIAQYVF